MIDFSLDRVNTKSPYEVILNHGDFDFVTEEGIRYSVSFLEDLPLGGCATYQFGFRRQGGRHAAHDPQIAETILALIDEFFLSNLNVLLYICDTSDGREEQRNRLFLAWFERRADKERFTIRTASAEVEGEGMYVGIIVENRNPLLTAITADFEHAAETLTNKP